MNLKLSALSCGGLVVGIDKAHFVGSRFIVSNPIPSRPKLMILFFFSKTVCLLNLPLK